MSQQMTFEQILTTPAPANRPVRVVEAKVVPKTEMTVLDPREAKRIDPYSAPTYEKFQAAFKRKYGRNPTAGKGEIDHYYKQHPEEWRRRQAERAKKEGKR